MALYALCVHPILRTLEDRLTGINIGKRGQRISVLAYADDITVFLTHREDIEKVNQAIRTYERATGSQLNPNKSRALAVGGWAEPITPLGIDLLSQVKILGVTFGSTVDATVQDSAGQWPMQCARWHDKHTPDTCASLTGCNTYKRTYYRRYGPRTGPTTADPPHPATHDDVHVVHIERCHLSCSHNDPPAAERSRWMGVTRCSPEMSGAPPW